VLEASRTVFLVHQQRCAPLHQSRRTIVEPEYRIYGGRYLLHQWSAAQTFTSERRIAGRQPTDGYTPMASIENGQVEPAANGYACEDGGVFDRDEFEEHGDVLHPRTQVKLPPVRWRPASTSNLKTRASVLQPRQTAWPPIPTSHRRSLKRT